MILPTTYWGGERNRCAITTPNGVQQLSIPVYDSRKEQPVEDIRICYMHSWQRQHWSALFSAYGKTPYFDYYADYIHAVYKKQPTFLVDFNNETAYILYSLFHNERPSAYHEDFVPICHPHALDLLFNEGPAGMIKGSRGVGVIGDRKRN